MPVEVIMPKVDMDMSSGRIAAWHVAPGGVVAKGDPLFDIETDKAAMEVEAPESGVLHGPVGTGVDVPIGQTVAWLYAEGEEIAVQPDAEARPAQPALPETPPETAPSLPGAIPAGEAVAQEQKPGQLRATPLARLLAKKTGISLETIQGSGPSGRVQARDLRNRTSHPLLPASSTPGFTPGTGPLAITRSPDGSGTPAVLLHGFASDAPSWLPIEPYICHLPRIRIELPAHGRSPRLPVSSFAGLAAEVRRAFESLEIPKAHLIGHNIGGALALALADELPRSVASLTLISPAGLGPEINHEAMTGVARASQTGNLGPWLRCFVANGGLFDDSYVRLVMASRGDPELRAAQFAMACALFPDGGQAIDLGNALARAAMPTRIIWGKNDLIIPWRHALWAPGRVALHLLDGVGHLPQIEASDEVGKILALHLTN